MFLFTTLNWIRNRLYTSNELKTVIWIDHPWPSSYYIPCNGSYVRSLKKEVVKNVTFLLSGCNIVSFSLYIFSWYFGGVHWLCLLLKLPFDCSIQLSDTNFFLSGWTKWYLELFFYVSQSDRFVSKSFFLSI